MMPHPPLHALWDLGRRPPLCPVTLKIKTTHAIIKVPHHQIKLGAIKNIKGQFIFTHVNYD